MSIFKSRIALLLIAFLCVVSLSFVFVACSSSNNDKTNVINDDQDSEKEVSEVTRLQAYGVISEQIIDLFKSGTYNVSASYKIPDFKKSGLEALLIPQTDSKSIQVKIDDKGIMFYNIDQNGNVDLLSGGYYYEGYRYDFLKQSEDGSATIECAVIMADPFSALSLVSEKNILDLLIGATALEYTSSDVVVDGNNVTFFISSDFSSIANKVVQAIANNYDVKFMTFADKVVDAIYKQIPLDVMQEPDGTRKSFENMLTEILDKIDTASRIINPGATLADLMNLLPQDVQGSINKTIKLISQAIANKFDIDIEKILTTSLTDIFTNLKNLASIDVDNLKESVISYLNTMSFKDIIDDFVSKGKISQELSEQIDTIINFMKDITVTKAECTVDYSYDKVTNKITGVEANATLAISMENEGGVSASLESTANFEIKIVDTNEPEIVFPEVADKGEVQMVVDYSEESISDDYYTITLNSLPFVNAFSYSVKLDDGDSTQEVAIYNNETNTISISKNWLDSLLTEGSNEVKLDIGNENITIKLKIKNVQQSQQESSSSSEQGDTTPTEQGDSGSSDQGDTNPTEQGDTDPTEQGDSSSSDQGDTTPTDQGDSSSTEQGDTTSTEQGDSSSTEQGDTKPSEDDSVNP